MRRRDFLKKGAGALALAALAPAGLAQSGTDSPRPKRPIHKAIMWGTVGVKGSVLEKMKMVKAAGFAGAEMNSHMDQDEVMRARDEGLEALKQTLRDAKRYGASSVLLVPAVVNKEVSYQDAYTRSQEEIRKAVPLAEELGVKIAIENVWNQFLLSPLEAARYVDEFNSPAVGWHFDVGNVINYGWPEQWVRILGKRIQKLHIKEFSRKRRDKEGLWKGFDVPLLEGDDDWPAVMKALDEVGYNGWAMTEQPGGDTPEGLQDLATRLGKILVL
jgi:hexulose-6-phosphate isomerase